MRFCRCISTCCQGRLPTDIAKESWSCHEPLGISAPKYLYSHRTMLLHFYVHSIPFHSISSHCIHFISPSSMFPIIYKSCLYGTLPSFSWMICSLKRHRFSPNSSSCACFDGSVTLRSGTILRIFNKGQWIRQDRAGRTELGVA